MLNTDTYRSVSVQFWDHDKYRFVHRGAGASIDGTLLSKIVSANVADFNNDGRLDVLLSDSDQGMLYFGDSNGNFNLSKPLPIPEISAALAVVDADADLVPDLFVAFANGTRGFWRLHHASPENVTFVPWATGSKVCSVVAGASIATVDLDGDCQPEFVVPTACGLEVWNSSRQGSPLWNMKAPTDMRLLGLDVFNSAQEDAVVVYADFDGDGTTDIAVANFYRAELVVHLNIQQTRKEGALCTRDAKWKLVRQQGASPGTFHVSAQRVGRLLRGYDLPATLDVGDFNGDGLADVLAIDADTGRPMLWRNLGHWRRDGSNAHVAQLVRKSDSSHLPDDAVAAAFWDTAGSGRQDVLVVRRSNDTRLAWNTGAHDSDALFFSGVALSALPPHGNPRPFAPVPGATFKVVYASRLTSRRVSRTCSQCPQSGHWRVRACGCVLELAHIANYIEEMAVGEGGFTRTWPNLMPNSMAVVWAEPGDGASKWRMEYFTQRRGGPMFSVVAVLIVALAALGAAIVYLQRKEKLQDIQDTALERARLFHFGGL